jgi:hypothetical protein
MIDTRRVRSVVACVAPIAAPGKAAAPLASRPIARATTTGIAVVARTGPADAGEEA